MTKSTAYQFREYVKRFLPGGLSRIVVGGHSVGQCGEALNDDPTVAPATLRCEYCKADIPPVDSEGHESTVYVYYGKCLCHACALKLE